MNSEILNISQNHCLMHNKNNQQAIIERFCVSESCDKISAMCKKCIKQHNHDVLITKSLQIIFSEFQKIQVSKKQQEKINNIKNSLCLIKNSFLSQFNKFIYSLFRLIDDHITKYQYAVKNPIDNIYKQKSQDLRKLLQRGLATNRQINPNLVKQINEFKVVLIQLKQKFTNLNYISRLINSLHNDAGLQINSTNIQTQINKINFNQISFSAHTAQYNTKLRQLRNLNQKKNNQFALQIAHQTIQFNPLNTHVYYQKAHTLFEIGRYEQSLINYKISNYFQTKTQQIYLCMAHCYRILQYYPQSLLQFDKALAINKKSLIGYFYKGLIYQQMNRLVQSLNCLSHALNIWTSLKQDKKQIKDQDEMQSKIHICRNRVIKKMKQVESNSMNNKGGST